MNTLHIKSVRRNEGDILEVKEDIASLEQVTNIAKTAIEADKDVVSKVTCVYDEDNSTTTITLPKYILPLIIYDDSFVDAGLTSLYFDYNNEEVLNTSNQRVGDINIVDEQCIITLEDVEITSLESPALTYMYFNNYEDTLNTYRLYNPNINATSLYKHTITLDNSETIIIVSTINTPYGLNDFANSMMFARDYISALDYSNSEEPIFMINYNPQTYEMVLACKVSDVTYTVHRITDSVTSYSNEN